MSHHVAEQALERPTSASRLARPAAERSTSFRRRDSMAVASSAWLSTRSLHIRPHWVHSLACLLCARCQYSLIMVQVSWISVL